MLIDDGDLLINTDTQSAIAIVNSTNSYKTNMLMLLICLHRRICARYEIVLCHIVLMLELVILSLYNIPGKMRNLEGKI